jgi:5-methylthioadenosine/S-adenosylhomocysteine deaminase
MTRSLAINGAVTVDGTRVALRAVEGVIVEVGDQVTPRPGDEVLDAQGDVLLRGLVNGHTHAAMTLFRGYGGDLPLMQWLEEKIWPAEARLTDDAVYWGTRLACIEMIRSGTTQCWDMYWRPVAVARAMRDAGMQATLGSPVIDGMDGSRSSDACAEASDLLDALADFAPNVTPSLAPHGIYTASDTTLAWVAEESARRDAPVQLHFLETADEVTGCLDRYGARPGALLEQVGLLSPRLVLAHGVWMEEPELELLAAHGVTVVTNPVSNLKLAVGRIFPYERVRAHGIAVGLGTDGASSNNSLDLLADVKLLPLLQKHAAGDAAALPAHEAWDVVTGVLAPTLRGGDASAVPSPGSSLRVGDPADCFLVRRDAPELTPGHVLDNLVYAASSSVVRSTVIAGRVVMRDGAIDGETEVRAKVVECAERLGVL